MKIVSALIVVVSLAACAGEVVRVPAATDTSSGSRPVSEVVDLSRFFGGLDGTFVLFDRNANRTVRHNPTRAAERFSPCSTFKIPNSLIAVETGVAPGPDYVIAWDRQRDPPAPWWDELGLDWKRDHTLGSALRHSVVWYYQELARRIGAERMARYVGQFRYGNQDLGGGLDTFWLSGDLAISADEQVEFLRRFHGEELALAPRTTEIVKRILVIEQGDGFVLAAKTGFGGRTHARPIGWFVGYVESRANVYFFALNLSGEDGAQVREARVPVAKAILREMGVLPPI